MAGIQPNGNPVYGTVKLSKLDLTGERELQDLIRTAVDFGAEVTEYGDAFPIAQLATAIAEEMVLETASKGVAIDKLCEGRTGEGHIREYFGEPLRDVVDIAVRALLPLTKRTAIHEYLRADPVRVGNESHAMGIDHEKGAPHLANLLVCSLGCCDRNLINQAVWLLSGTHDDRTSQRANWSRIEVFEEELGRPLPGSVDEHLEMLFAAEARAKEKVSYAAKRGHPAFQKAEIDAIKFERFCFPKCVILDRLPFGPARPRPAEDFTQELFPGDDENVIATVERAGKYGVARCKLEEPEIKVGYAALEDVLLPALAERLGEPPEAISPRRLSEVAKWNLANLLGVGANIRQVRIWRFPRSGRLLRAMQVSDQRGEFLDADLWRTIRLSDEDSLRAAFALIERAQQVWPRSCIRRYREEFQPGLVKASSATSRTGLLYSSLIANGAGVSAHREMEIRELGEHE